MTIAKPSVAGEPAAGALEERFRRVPPLTDAPAAPWLCFAGPALFSDRQGDRKHRYSLAKLRPGVSTPESRPFIEAGKDV